MDASVKLPDRVLAKLAQVEEHWSKSEREQVTKYYIFQTFLNKSITSVSVETMHFYTKVCASK